MMRSNFFTPPNPFPMVQSNGEFYDYSKWGRVQVTPSTFRAGTKKVCLIYTGDSLHASTDGQIFTPTNVNAIHNLSLQNGGLYVPTTPAISCTDEGVPSINGFHGFRTADKLINAGTADQIVIASIAIGSTGTADWAVGGVCNWRMATLNARLAFIGMTGVKTYILHDNGIQDALGVTSSATVVANLLSFIATVRALPGWSTTPILLSPSSTLSAGALPSSTNVAAALAAVLSPANANVFVGCNSDDFTPATYRYDGAHLNTAGSDLMATREAAIITSHP